MCMRASTSHGVRCRPESPQLWTWGHNAELTLGRLFLCVTSLLYYSEDNLALLQVDLRNWILCYAQGMGGTERPLVQ